MDGTLLNNDKKVTERSKIAIKKAHDKGIKVAISTGRLFASAKYYAELLEIKAPVIAANGAYIREKDRDEVIYQSAISLEGCKEILSIVEKYDFNFFYNTFNAVISTRPFQKGNTYLEMNRYLPEEMKIQLHVNENLREEFEKIDEKILKCICIGNNRDDLLKAKEEIIKTGKFEVASSLSDNFEIMSKGTSKGNAVKVLADFYGLKKEDVICIGDGENDLSMIKYAGMGIAMGNATQYVKEVADYITDTNENDGVAKAIEKFML
jgi:Cof subfamily protein (haloacid dehalogenase superfamily)